ncbi:acyl-CoA N-acyltransferase [Microstroma glucosiphilum]|uniref:Acyl-CoA N-acyltransferase n=1 Tax=Pseudomicrostroma glucosiphilum TaxID=1684307 RepID=A0A316UEG3_9BASI|nr:acyl-CoA N-acyltransferase [Pseudomicrostroma glucosiphilum]PWN23609.1 acyl-CoA N-acyltransferase [Pseudomicrostroma glucosiphilum]
MATAAPAAGAAAEPSSTDSEIYYTQYKSEVEIPIITALIEKELSEPYIVYTYRYFVNQWPQLTWLAWQPCPASQHESSAEPAGSSIPGTGARNINDIPVGVVICKLDRHLKGERRMRGYIAMLSVHPSWRGKGIASRLVQLSISSMLPLKAQEVVLETEVDNLASLKLYDRLGFMREKRLHRFYLNGKDCFRLVLPLQEEVKDETTEKAGTEKEKAS